MPPAILQVALIYSTQQRSTAAPASRAVSRVWCGRQRAVRRLPAEGFHHGAENQAANKVTEVKGKIKKNAGQATDGTGLEAEGRAEEAKGDLKQAGEKVKDAFKK